jgi:nitroreductase
LDSLLHLMRRNRGNRKFSDRPVRKPILDKILEAGNSAPSGVVEGVHIFVIDSDDKRNDIHRLCVETERVWLSGQPASVRKRITSSPEYDSDLEYILKAPLLLIVSTRPNDPECPYAVEVAFIAIGYMLVMANGMGLIAAPYAPSIMDDVDEKRLNSMLSLPPGECIQALLPIGYPESPSVDIHKGSVRNIFLNEFGTYYFSS